MSENYLVINGKKTELTQEQLAKLGIEVKKENPFDVKDGESAYYINSKSITKESEFWSPLEIKELLPCKDKQIVEERAKQERLSRLLWKFAIENDGYLSEEERNDSITAKWGIRFKMDTETHVIEFRRAITLYGALMFKSKEVAQRAIDEVILPFERGEIE